MARVQFTFTFTNAQPGASAHFSAVVYADATTTTPDGPSLVLDPSNTVSVWSDAGYVIATTVDGNGQPISVTATADSPTVTDSDGTAGVNPFTTPTLGNTTITGALTHTGTTAGFFSHVVHAQPAAIADSTDAPSAITQLNLALAALRDLGLIAT